MTERPFVLQSSKRLLHRSGLFVTEPSQFTLLCVQVLQPKAEAAESFADRIADPIEAVAPGPNATAFSHGGLWLWSAPGEWLVMIPEGTKDAVLNALQPSEHRQLCVVHDVTDGYAILNLYGEKVRQILARGSSVDFHPSRFADGDCCVTRLAGIRVLLVQLAGESLLIADVSYSDYLQKWLEAVSID
ncbi:MAG: sarcosine oxidase subunit gamma family protein [Pseudomonadota bacterium]